MTPMANTIQLEPFIDREDECSLVSSKLEAIKQGEWLFDFILTVSGIPGIGKTTLLEKIREDAASRNTDTIFITYHAESKEENGYLYLLEEIAEPLFQNAPDWRETVQLYRESNDKSNQYESLIRSFSTNLKTILDNKPIALLIDDSHNIKESVQDMLEDVLERVYHKNRLFVTLAGRADVRWKSFELRRRARLIRLNYFEEKIADQLLAGPKDPALSGQIYRLTKGYPLASVQAYEWISRNLQPDFTHQLQEKETELVFELVDTLLSQYLLVHIKDRDRRELMAELLKKVSPLRRFDDMLLYRFLNASDILQHPDSIDTLKSRSYIREMVSSTYVVRWDSARMAYSLDLPIRQLFSLGMKFRDIAGLVKIHEVMTNCYQQYIDEAVKRDPSAPQTVIYLTEYIFHFANACQLKGQTDHMGFEIQKQIETLFKGYYVREKNHFYEEVKKDHELAQLLGDTYHQLTEFVAKQV